MKNVVILPKVFIDNIDKMSDEINSYLNENNDVFRNSNRYFPNIKDTIKENLIIGSYKFFYKICVNDGNVSRLDLREMFTINKTIKKGDKSLRLVIDYPVFINTLTENGFIEKTFKGNNFNKLLSSYKIHRLSDLQIFNIINTPHKKLSVSDLETKYKTNSRGATVITLDDSNPFAKVNSQIKTLKETSFDFEKTVIGVQQKGLTPEQIYKGAVDINHINEGYFNISLTPQDRIYSTITTIKKEFREFLLINDQKTKEVDIPCAQPMIAFSLFMKSKEVFTKEEQQEIEKLKEIFENPNRDFYNEFIIQIYRKEKNLLKTHHTDLSTIQKYYKHIKIRSYVKGYILKTMYDTKTFKNDGEDLRSIGYKLLSDLNLTEKKKNEPGYSDFISDLTIMVKHHKRIYLIFDELFPNFLKFINSSKFTKEEGKLHEIYKKQLSENQNKRTYNTVKPFYENVNVLWNKAQLLESKIITDTLYSLGDNKLKYFTVHDSLLVKINDYDRVKEQMEKSLLKITGLKITI